MAPTAGLEPATLRLTAGCSTIELDGNEKALTLGLEPKLGVLTTPVLPTVAIFFCAYYIVRIT